MNALAVTYTYQYGVIDSLATNPAFFAIAVVLMIALAFASPYIYGYMVYLAREREKQEKKKTISNLRVMNEIQTELETEMKEARIRASLKTS